MLLLVSSPFFLYLVGIEQMPTVQPHRCYDKALLLCKTSSQNAAPSSRSLHWNCTEALMWTTLSQLRIFSLAFQAVSQPVLNGFKQVQVTCVLGQENGKLWTGIDAKTSTSSQNPLIATVNSLCFPPISPTTVIDMKGNIWLWQCQGELILSLQSSHCVLNLYITMLWVLSNVYLLFPCFLVSSFFWCAD